MDANVHKSTVSSTVTQTDLVSSPILWQCLYVIKTVPEFINLSYRVTKTHNDVEVLVVFREGVLGVFGPPVEPISLTLDHRGRCLLTILFKPVERVSIVSPESGQIQVSSLLAMLRLLAGKGYFFCPGFPETFLTGKACGQFVVVHKVPFKRYQSAHCLVYYQGSRVQKGPASSSLCALCPRCMHAAKCIHALPVFAGATAAQMPKQLLFPGQLKSDPRNIIDSSTDSASPPTCTDGQLPSHGQTLHADCLNNKVTSCFSDPQKTSNLGSKRQASDVDVNGNTEATVSFTDHKTEPGTDGRHISVDAKIQVLTQVLTNLMQVQGHGHSVQVYRVTDPEMSGIQTVSRKSKKTYSDYMKKSSQGKRNVCHHCKKQYSSPANLLSHLQRHAALPGTWQNKFQHRKRHRKPSVFTVMRRMFHESRVSLTMSKDRPVVLSEMSVRLFLQYLDDLISSQNGAKSVQQQQHSSKTISATAGNMQNSNSLQTVLCEQVASGGIPGIRCGIPGTRCGLKRRTTDFSPMHTLLQAAVIAEVGQLQNNLFIPSSVTPGKHEEAAVRTNLQAPDVGSQISEDSVTQNKRRKSSRLASKRAKDLKTRVKDADCCTATVDMDCCTATVDMDCCTATVDMDQAAESQEQSMLTNLNLLSTVSLETAMRRAASDSQTTAAMSSSNSPTIVSPARTTQMNIVSSASMSQSAVSELPPPQLLPKSVNIPQNVLNNMSGGNIVISKCQVACGADTDLPPVPPLLFAGDAQRKGLLYPVLSQQQQQQQSQSQTVHASTSLLRSLVTDSRNRLVLPQTKSIQKLSLGHHCGAIDLSKPKLSHATTGISLSTEKNTDLSSLSGLPHNGTQALASSNPSEALQCFMLMANSAGIVEQRESQSLPTVRGDKQADSDLQARMFASARSYRLEAGATHSPQVQAVIASSSQTTQPGKAMKPGAHTEEIQCGYKWSGSGGLVKERTQMVRELVTPDVMASYLTKSLLGSQPSQPLNSTMYNTSQPQLSGAQKLSSFVAGWATRTQDSSSSELALNLMTSRLADNPASKDSAAGQGQKATRGVALSASLLDRSATSPGSILQNILRSSLTNKSAILNHQLESSSDIPFSPVKVQPKTLILSLTRSSTPTSFSSSPVPPSHCTVSSPSLAAMLRQPSAAAACQSGNTPAHVVSASVPATHQHKLATDNCPVQSLPRGVHIKLEPPESDSTEQVTVVTGLPLKAEQEPGTESLQLQEASGTAHGAQNGLIIDLNPETTACCDTDKLQSAATKTPHLATKHTSVRCKH